MDTNEIEVMIRKACQAQCNLTGFTLTNAIRPKQRFGFDELGNSYPRSTPHLEAEIYRTDLEIRLEAEDFRGVIVVSDFNAKAGNQLYDALRRTISNRPVLEDVRERGGLRPESALWREFVTPTWVWKDNSLSWQMS